MGCMSQRFTLDSCAKPPLNTKDESRGLSPTERQKSNYYDMEDMINSSFPLYQTPQPYLPVYSDMIYTHTILSHIP